jgi:hypothetical protein
MNMINSADDLDLYNEYMYMYIDPDREYLIMKFIAIGFSLSICAAILFLKMERKKFITNGDINDNKDISI